MAPTRPDTRPKNSLGGTIPAPCPWGQAGTGSLTNPRPKNPQIPVFIQSGPSRTGYTNNPTIQTEFWDKTRPQTPINPLVSELYFLKASLGRVNVVIKTPNPPKLPPEAAPGGSELQQGVGTGKGSGDGFGMDLGMDLGGCSQHQHSGRFGAPRGEITSQEMREGGTETPISISFQI